MTLMMPAAVSGKATPWTFCALASTSKKGRVMTGELDWPRLPIVNRAEFGPMKK